MHNHKFEPSSKKDICYCITCQNLSYKGTIGQSLLINPINFNIDPLKLKFLPFSTEKTIKWNIIQNTWNTEKQVFQKYII